MGRIRTTLVALLYCSLFTVAAAQIAKRRPTMSKGPRAVGIVEVAENGSARLVPVTIMIDGKFYDASIYKADPVPMALQPETVYEGVKSGVSQGLFTVRGGVQTPSWLGLGTWKSSEQLATEKSKHEERVAKLSQKATEDITAGGPPRLTRSPQKETPNSPPSSDSQSKPSDEKQPAPVTMRPQRSTPALAEVEADRPVLRRQAPGQATEQTKSAQQEEPLKGPLQIIPAISDAEGPQPRPYTYSLKPGEEEEFLHKMEALAAEAVQERARSMPASSATSKKPTATQKPDLTHAQLRIFDVSNSNEAVLVLTADATMPGRADILYSTAIAARQDIYGDLHKIFSQTTDNKHLDIQPKYEFIDAVDADGDSRGELLFRQTWDSGSGFAVYRVIGDRLWPLFESKPSS